MSGIHARMILPTFAQLRSTLRCGYTSAPGTFRSAKAILHLRPSVGSLRGKSARFPALSIVGFSEEKRSPSGIKRIAARSE